MSRFKPLHEMKRRNEERLCNDISKRLRRERAKVARERIREEYILEEKYEKEMRKEDRERKRYKEVNFANYMKRIENTNLMPILCSEGNAQLQPFDFVCVSPIKEEDEEQITEDPLRISNDVLHSPRGKSEPYNASDSGTLTYNSYSYHEAIKEEAENSKLLPVMDSASSSYYSVSSEELDLTEIKPHLVTYSVPTVSDPSSYSSKRAINDCVKNSGQSVIHDISSACVSQTSHQIRDRREERSESHLLTYTAQASNNSFPADEFINEDGARKVNFVIDDVSSTKDMAPSHKAIDRQDESVRSGISKIPTKEELLPASLKDIDMQGKNSAPHSSMCSAVEQKYLYASCKQMDEEVAINESVIVRNISPAFSKRNVPKKRERKSKHNVLQWDKYEDCVEEVSFFSYCWPKNGNSSICDKYNKFRSVGVKQEKFSETSESNSSLEYGSEPWKIESDVESFIPSDFESDESKLSGERSCVIRPGNEINDQSSKKSLSCIDILNKTNFVTHSHALCQQSDFKTDESRFLKEKPCITSLGLEICNQSLKQSSSLTDVVNKTLSVNQNKPIDFENEIPSLEPIFSEKCPTETSVTKVTDGLLHSKKESGVTCSDSSSSRKHRKRKSPHQPLLWDSP